jgi:hypothetical protein
LDQVPQTAEPLAAEPLAAEPLAAEPLAAEPLAAPPLAAVLLLPAAAPVSDTISADPEPMTRALVVVSPNLRLRNTVL